MNDNMVVEALRYMLAEVEEKLTSVEEENAQLKAEIDDLKEKNRWIPVSERQPESNRRVIFISLEGTVYCGMHQSSVPQWVADGCYFHSSWYKFVTHWMPLPEPPQEVEE